MKQPRVGIAVTLKNAEAVLKTFVDYHLSIGFDKIFLFFDDPEDTSIDQVSHMEGVSIFRCNEALKKRWSTTNLYKTNTQMASFVNVEPMARQLLNVQVAIQESLELGLDWILHIDIDELFVSSEPIHEHFTMLEEAGLKSVNYTNHEALPESMEISNYFNQVTLFKKNYRQLTKDQKDWWSQKMGVDARFFHFYGNGKSAAKVNKNLLTTSVHEFYGDEFVVHDPYILHYACCGIENFLTKYRTLGNFKDKWFDTWDIEFSTHLKSRDVIAEQDQDKVDQFYKNVFLFEPSFIDQCQKQGLLFRKDPIKTILSKI